MDIKTQRSLYKKSLFFSASVLMIGALFRIMHWPYADLLLGISFVLSLGYILIGLLQVLRSTYWSFIEKFFWTLGFLLLPLIVGLIYYNIVIKSADKI